MSGMLFAPHSRTFQENMTEVELECAVYGEGTVFPVTIARDAKVSALKEAIYDKRRYRERFSFDANSLTLYLARKNGEWLKDEDSMDAFLQGEVDKQCTKMRSTWTLADEELLGEDFQPGRREVHVLVELPEAAVGVASEQPASNKMLKEIHEQVVQTKRKRYTHSQMTSDKGNELLQELNILVEPVDRAPFTNGDPTHVEVFQWERITNVDGQEIVLHEEQQRERYRAYVEANIGNVLERERLCVLGVEDKNIINAKVPGHDIELVGRTDILVLSNLVRNSPEDVQYLPGVRMLIEVKKEVKDSSDFQALSELIALDLRSSGPVMALLTDFNHKWKFFWVSEKNERAVIQKTTIREPGEAFQVIRTLLEQSPTGVADMNLPFIGEPVKRRKLDQLLPSISEGGDSGGILEAIERYRDITSLMGRPDIDMARAVGYQIVRSMPAFSMYT